MFYHLFCNTVNRLHFVHRFCVLEVLL